MVTECVDLHSCGVRDSVKLLRTRFLSLCFVHSRPLDRLENIQCTYTCVFARTCDHDDLCDSDEVGDPGRRITERYHAWKALRMHELR